MEKSNKTFFLKTPVGKLISFTCPLTKNIKTIKEIIKDKEGFNQNKYYLTYKSRYLYDKNTLEDYNVQENDTIFINVYMCGD